MLLLLLLIGVEMAQAQHSAQRIYLRHADALMADAASRPGLQVAKGNVNFLHRGAILLCDSAHFWEKQNAFNAYGHVRFRQGDTLSLTAQRVMYDGQQEMIRARGNVVLRHRKTTLYADSLDFDRRNNMGYYFEGGRLVDEQTQLVSDWGEYHTDTREARFFYSVTLKKDNDYIETDSLLYNTRSSTATVVGRSVIYTDGRTITTQHGYYDTKAERTQLYSRSTIEDNDMTITADTLFNDKQTGLYEAQGRVEYRSKKDHNELYAGYCRYDSQQGTAFATQRPVAKEYSQGDTLWLHADTLRMKTFHIDTDSMFREVYVYHHARVYRSDVQAVADSISYNTRDSLLTLLRDPIVWSDNRQIVGEKIDVILADSTVRRVDVLRQALSIEQMDDRQHYNQVAATKMTAYFDEKGNMRRTDAIGNVKTIYYPQDDKDSTIMALNYLEGDTMRMYIDTLRQLDKIWVSKPVGTAYPLIQTPADRTQLPGFAWFDYIRPRDPDDIFEWRPKNDDQRIKTQQRFSPPTLTLEVQQLQSQSQSAP
ncbi:MAG: hypothetical protein J6I60_04060 [Bacteroidaceae bacterium]|nr:hypothetical protein [Bacteroidaceae bacterium]